MFPNKKRTYNESWSKDNDQPNLALVQPKKSLVFQKYRMNNLDDYHFQKMCTVVINDAFGV